MVNVGERLSNLAFLMAFTVAVTCCSFLAVLYCIGPWSATGTQTLYSSENRHGAAVPRFVKRTTRLANRFRYYESCIAATPSKEDVHKLCAHHECTTVHCVRSCPCGDNKCKTSSRTSCMTRACLKFRVKVAQAEHEVTLESLSGIVNDYLSGWPDSSSIDLKCSDENSHLYDRKLSLEITRDGADICISDHAMQPENGNIATETQLQNRAQRNLYLIYFRLMSKWESFVKLPQLNALLEHKRNDTFWNLHTFDNVQSHSMVLNDNLRAVLGLLDDSSSRNKSEDADNEDLIELATKNNMCVFFHTLACHQAQIFSEIQEKVQTANNGTCYTPNEKHSDTNLNPGISNHSFCSDSSHYADIEDILYMHDRLGQIYPTTETNSFSILVINIPDLKSTEAFDTAITGLITRVLSDSSNTLILMSDVGNPQFSRLDESVFLRTQVFNPLLHVFITKATSEKTPAFSLLISNLAATSRKSTIDISSVRPLTQTMLIPSAGDWVKAKIKMDASLADTESTGNTRENETLNTFCPVGRVEGPVECVCKGKHVRFPNDSIQIAFANYIVANVNKRLMELSSLNNFRFDPTYSKQINPKARQLLRNRFVCDRLYGISVASVNHVSWNRSTFILMTLLLQPASRPDSHPIRLEVETEYTTDDHYNINFSTIILHPTQVSLSVPVDSSTSTNSRKLRHLLCIEPDGLAGDHGNHLAVLDALASESQFGVTARTKSLHHPCLHLLTWNYGESALLELANVCSDRSYNATVAVEYINILPLSVIPTELVVGPREVRYISTLVKNGYWVSKCAYKINVSYVVITT